MSLFVYGEEMNNGNLWWKLARNWTFFDRYRYKYPDESYIMRKERRKKTRETYKVTRP